jgi:ribose-phosphate pyrophosphokinase
VTLIGEVKDKNVILLDDMIDSGGTLLNVCKELKNQGAKKIIVLVTLPFFNGDAPDAFQRAYEDGFLHKVISTNAVKQDGVLNREWFKAVDITPLLAQVIERVHEGKSISMMLDSTMEILQL